MPRSGLGPTPCVDPVSSWVDLPSSVRRVPRLFIGLCPIGEAGPAGGESGDDQEHRHADLELGQAASSSSPPPSGQRPRQRPPPPPPPPAANRLAARAVEAINWSACSPTPILSQQHRQRCPPRATRPAGTTASPASPWPSTTAPRPSRWASRVARRLPVGLALQLAQDDGDAVLLGQAAQLPVEGLGQVIPKVSGHRLGLRHVRHLAFPPPPLGPRRSRFHGRLVRHAVEPVAELLPWHDRSRLAGEDEERRLEGVLGVVVIPEDPAADAPDHRAVAPDDRLEDRLLSPGDEAIQELPVRQSPPSNPLPKSVWSSRPATFIPPSPPFRLLFVVLARPLPAYYPVESVLIHFFPRSPPRLKSHQSRRDPAKRGFSPDSRLRPLDMGGL